MAVHGSIQRFDRLLVNLISASLMREVSAAACNWATAAATDAGMMQSERLVSWQPVRQVVTDAAMQTLQLHIILWETACCGQFTCSQNSLCSITVQNVCLYVYCVSNFTV